MKISTFMAVFFLASVVIMLPSSGQAGLGGSKGEDCIGTKGIAHSPGCQTGLQSRYYLVITATSLNTCEPVNYTSSCKETPQTVGRQYLFELPGCGGKVLWTGDLKENGC